MMDDITNLPAPTDSAPAFPCPHPPFPVHSSSVASISALAKMTRGAKRRMLPQNRLLVVEAQTVAQLQGPGQSVLLDGMAAVAT
jgi:hypothetical protein